MSFHKKSWLLKKKSLYFLQKVFTFYKKSLLFTVISQYSYKPVSQMGYCLYGMHCILVKLCSLVVVMIFRSKILTPIWYGLFHWFFFIIKKRKSKILLFKILIFQIIKRQNGSECIQHISNYRQPVQVGSELLWWHDSCIIPDMW